MSDPVNLNKFRKQKARAEKNDRAEKNRVLHGTPKDLRRKAEKAEEIRNRRLDGHKMRDEGDK